MKARTAETITEAFEGVVLRGTGKRAALEGYRAAGKTGTARKIVNGQYVKGAYVSTFIGFAPLPNPKISILVQLDEPREGYYGGDVCAPCFKNIAQEVLLQLRIPPDSNLPLPEYPVAASDAVSEDFIPDDLPAPPPAASNTNTPDEKQPDVITVQIKKVVLPDFRGLSKRSVLNRCIELGIHLKSKGSGIAIFQSPLPGTEIPVGDTCSVIFTKTDLIKEQIAAIGKQQASPQEKLQLLSNNSP